jgi:hypothetical protein
MVQTGRIDQVAQYCESDFVNKADIIGSMPLLIQIKPVCLLAIMFANPEQPGSPPCGPQEIS